MTLIRRFARAFRLLEQQNTLIDAQQRLIHQLHHDLSAARLEHAREMHGVVSAWRIHTETPEIDIRDDLTALATTLGHQAAMLEEHVV